MKTKISYVIVQVPRRQNRSGGKGRNGRFKWVYVYKSVSMRVVVEDNDDS